MLRAGLAQLPAVPEPCLAAQLASNYGFTPLVTSLGMSYLKRLAAQVWRHSSLRLRCSVACASADSKQGTGSCCTAA